MWHFRVSVARQIDQMDHSGGPVTQRPEAFDLERRVEKKLRLNVAGTPASMHRLNFGCCVYLESILSYVL